MDFGYQINAGKQIDFDKNDRKLAAYIRQKEPSLNICFSCGTCTATCTSGNFTEFNFRKLIILLKHGENEDLKAYIARCMLCGKCILACPRGVNTRNILFHLKRYFDHTDIQ